MKKWRLALSLVLLLALLAGCTGPGGTASSGGAPSTPVSTSPSGDTSASVPTDSAPTGSGADYRAVIEASRPAELNDIAIYSIVTGPEDDMYNMFFEPALGFVEADMQRYALSLTQIITKAYGIAIVLPAEGKTEAVQAQLNAYVEQQRKVQQNYLPDQYEIAKAAIVKALPTGEVIMVMVEDAATVAANIEEELNNEG